VARLGTSVDGRTRHDDAGRRASCFEPPPPDFSLRSKPDSPASLRSRESDGLMRVRLEPRRCGRDARGPRLQSAVHVRSQLPSSSRTSAAGSAISAREESPRVAPLAGEWRTSFESDVDRGHPARIGSASNLDGAGGTTAVHACSQRSTFGVNCRLPVGPPPRARRSPRERRAPRVAPLAGEWRTSFESDVDRGHPARIGSASNLDGAGGTPAVHACSQRSPLSRSGRGRRDRRSRQAGCGRITPPRRARHPGEARRAARRSTRAARPSRRHPWGDRRRP